MSDNIYAPPTAELSEAVKPSAEFYVISQKKLLILSLLSFGLYTYVWAYKNWSLYKKANQADIVPLARALFLSSLSTSSIAWPTGELSRAAENSISILSNGRRYSWW